MKDWYVYILRCADSTLYTGITTDIERRLEEHNGDKLGAKYTRSRQPVNLVYSEKLNSRSAASTREAAVKKMTKKSKERMIR